MSTAVLSKLENVLVPTKLLQDKAGSGVAARQSSVQVDLVLDPGHPLRIAPTQHKKPADYVVLPKLTEPHVHLDKCHTVDRIPNVGGDLLAAIAAQGADRDRWTETDIRTRAERGLHELIAAGCKTVRTHVDWSYGPDAQTPPLSWHVLTDLAQDYRAQVNLQVSPLVSIDTWADQTTAKAITKTVATKSTVIGAFVLGQPERHEGIQNAFHCAADHGLMLDFHVDEGLDPDLDGLESITRTAAATSFDRPILCGHACALATKSKTGLDRLIADLQDTSITIAALPSTNLYLQGRNTGTPTARGLTTIKELRSAGIPVILGTDNVRDAFCPIGRHNPMKTLADAILAAHLDPPLEDHLPMITDDAARALGEKPITLDQANPDDLIAFKAASLSQVLADLPVPIPLTDLISGDTA